MQLHQLNYFDKTNDVPALPDEDLMAIKRFMETAFEFQKPFDFRSPEENLILSENLKTYIQENRVIPNYFIDDTNILNNCGIYLNMIDDQAIAENIFASIQEMLSKSEFAISAFIKLSPGEMMLNLSKKYNSILIRRSICQILNHFCQINEGVSYILSTPLISFIVSVTKELFVALSTDSNENSPNADLMLDLLEIFQSICYKSPSEIHNNINTFFEIVSLSFDSPHFRRFISRGVKILHILSTNKDHNYLIEIVKNGIFAKIMEFLSNRTLRPHFQICIDLASYFIQNNDNDLLFVADVAQMIPIGDIIQIFIDFPEDDDLIFSCFTLFINLTINGSEFVDNFLKDPEFLNKTQYYIAMGSSKIRKSGMWLIWNMLYSGMMAQRRVIINTGIFEYITDSFQIDDPQFILGVVFNSCIRMIKSFRMQGLEASEPFDKVVGEIISNMRDLVYSDNEKIKDAACSFFKAYFPEYD